MSRWRVGIDGRIYIHTPVGWDNIDAAVAELKAAGVGCRRAGF